MKRGIWVFVMMLLVAGGWLWMNEPWQETPSAAVADGDVVIFRLAETMAESHPICEAMNYFGELVEERSLGTMKVKIYDEGVLGSETSVLEQVRFGGIAMGRVNSANLIEQIPVLTPYFEPGAYEDSEGLMEGIQDEAEQISDVCQMERVEVLAWFYPDLRCFYSDEEQIKTLKDIQDKNILVVDSGILQNGVTRLGGHVVDSQVGDIYKSMGTGYMDIGEGTFGEVMCSEQYPFFHYVTVSDYMAMPDALVIGTAEYSVLSNENRMLLKECAEEAASYYRDLLMSEQTLWFDRLANDQKSVVSDPDLDELLKAVVRNDSEEQAYDD